MILYNIQHFGQTRYLPWLVTMLQHPENHFLITYDGSQSDIFELQKILNALDLDAKRILVRPSIPIHWCGPSQAKMLIEILRDALEIPGWDFFVNLSGTCIPLQSQELIRRRILSSYREGRTANLFSWPVKGIPEMPSEDFEGGREIFFKGRLRLYGTQSILKQFFRENYFPIRNVRNRVYLGCSEPDLVNKTLEIYRPSTPELDFRKSFFKSHQHFCGPAWYIFHKSACEKLTSFFESPASDDARQLFLSCFEPDESFLPTIIRGLGVLKADEVSNDSLRSFQGSMRRISDDSKHLLMGELHQLFARKVNYDLSSKIMSYVERVVKGNNGADLFG